MADPVFVLASASPIRQSLLRAGGLVPVVCPSDFDEGSVSESDPAVLVQRLAQGKAERVAPQFAHREALVLGCDSVLWTGSEICGKPKTPERAIALWQRLRGGKGVLYTGHCLIDVRQQKTLVRVGATTVHFAVSTDREIASYVGTGEPLHCAGGFTLEGLGGWLIEGLEGCHTNVLGLSLPLLRQMLRELGYLLEFGDDRRLILR
ncbi:MAG: septum formation inhibitor Maf [Oscillatoriales cyanobacterium SM2_1_8]|nr:septum formation inhibitor Maf [Oscillatoriales cyanobacterium SM2_1_8]